GPDAGVLNEVVSSQLTSGMLTDGAFLELWNGDYLDSLDALSPGPYAALVLGLRPLDPSAGVSFVVSISSLWPLFFSTDAFGYPVVQPLRVTSPESPITTKPPPTA